ncbi:MAG TPA: hypothetical protein VGG28_35110 [Kofleriaceae bacterium]|jgi:hypothetical protein
MTGTTRTAIVLGLALGAACSNNSSPHGTLTDAAPQTDAEHGSGGPSADAGPQTITLQNFGSVPTFVRYRAGSGAWQTPTANNGGETYSVTALDDFVFVAACISTDGTISETQIDATVSDTMLQFGCFSDDSSGGSAQVVSVTGTMKQPGFVAMSATDAGSAANWSFTLAEPPDSEVALQDLFAVGSAAMLIQRDIDIGSGASYAAGAIDLTNGGAAFAPVTIAVTNMNQDDTFEGIDELATPNEFATLTESTDPTKITPTPTSLLGSKDFEIWELDTADATSERVYETYAGAATSFAMPANLTGITFATGGASWTSLDSAWQDVALELSGGTQEIFHSAQVVAYSDWLAATSTTSLAYDDSAPGWMPAWSFWKTEAYQPSFLAEQEGQTSYQSSTAIGTSTSPAFTGKRHRAAAVRDLASKHAIRRNRR